MIHVAPDRCRNTAATSSWVNTTGAQCGGFAHDFAHPTDILFEDAGTETR
jgi:hypothetical protein